MSRRQKGEFRAFVFLYIHCNSAIGTPVPDLSPPSLKFEMEYDEAADTVILQQDSISNFNNGGLRSGTAVPIAGRYPEKTQARNSPLQTENCSGVVRCGATVSLL